MANTLKFGNGEWYGKEDTILAYNDERNNFKPLPFSFERGSVATRINKEGLIETVGANEPRIDYKDDSKGALLLEPTRTNYIPYSTLDFNGGSSPSGWSIGFGTGTYSYEQLEYKGQKAVKQTQITTGRSYLDTGVISILTNTEHTLKIQFILDECNVDEDDFILVLIGFGSTVSYKFSDVDENGILEVQYNPLSDNTGNIRLGLGCNGNEDGSKYLSWAMPQLEQGSYATSYIPTQGGVETRLRDLSDTQNLSNVIGQTEGVIFYDAILVHKSTSTSEDLFELSIDDGSNQNIFFINNYNNTLVVAMLNGGSYQFSNNSFNPTEGARYKLAFAYKQNDFALYINGNQIATDLIGTVPTMNQITFGNYYNNSISLSNIVKVNNLKFYNTRLSNSELATLTQV